MSTLAGALTISVLGLLGIAVVLIMWRNELDRIDRQAVRAHSPNRIS